MGDFNVIGKSYPGIEAINKSLGKAKYTDDYVLPNMVYGLILRSPYAHAKVKSIDKSQAEKVPGVLTIVLPWDIPNKVFNCSGNPPSPLLFEDEKILTDYPLYMGDRIAAVAGVTKEACVEAIDKLIVIYEELTPIFNTEDAIKSDAIALHPEITSNNIIKKTETSQGDVDKGFEESDYIFEEVFYTPMIQNVSMEPNSCICDYTIEEKLNIICNSQTSFQERRILAELLDMKENDIRIINPIMGGGFGERAQIQNQHIGAILSRDIGKPVKIINTREEQMVASCVRHSTQMVLKVGVTADGDIKALKIKSYFNTGAYATHGPTVIAASSRKAYYKIPNYLFEGYCVYTNHTPSGAVRGYGNPQVTFAREVMLDIIAKKLNIPPIEFRMKNHIKIGDKMPAQTSSILSCATEECLKGGENIRKEIDEKEEKEAVEKDANIKEAWGIAFCCHASGPSSKEGMSSSIILINDDGTANLIMGSADIGQGSETVLSQMVAEGLGVELKDITINTTDTQTTPYDTGTFASSQTYVGGNAVLMAAKDAREKIVKGLTKTYDIVSEDISFEDGCFTLALSDNIIRLTFKEAISKVTFDKKGVIIIGNSSYKAKIAPPPFAICWAKVAINTLTGSIQLKHIIEAVDVGKAINPGLVEGQVHGGIHMGVGYAMAEQIETDRKTKKVLSSDLLYYATPLTLDMPEIHVYIADGYEPSGPFGAKSVGELPTIPVAPAIANAISNATGKLINKIPITHSYYPKGFNI